MVSKTRDTSKYCEFHQDYGHDTNACKELKSQIEEAVRSGKLAHLIKRIRKGKAKKADAQLGEWIGLTVKAEQAMEGKEEPILMVGMVNNPLKRKGPPKIMSIKEMIFLPIRNKAPSVDPIIIRVQVHGRHDGNRRIRDDPHHDALNSSVSVRSQTKGHYVRIPRRKKMRVSINAEANPLEAPLQVFKCFNPEEKNHNQLKIPKANGDHRRQLPTKAKQELVKLLKDNVNIFAWQYSDMTGIPRTLKIGGTNFATKHKLKENKKATPVQQKKRRMDSERAIAASKEVEELRKA
ncbi:hypothetical protein Tco_0085299 [Tanacetum coccineum]